MGVHIAHMGEEDSLPMPLPTKYGIVVIQHREVADLTIFSLNQFIMALGTDFH